MTSSLVVWKPWKRWLVLFTDFAFVCLRNTGSTQEHVLPTWFLASPFALFLANGMIDVYSNSSHLDGNFFQVIPVNWLLVLVFGGESSFSRPIVFCIGYSKVLHQGWLLEGTHFETKVLLVAFWQCFLKIHFSLYRLNFLFLLYLPQGPNSESLLGLSWALIVFNVW